MSSRTRLLLVFGGNSSEHEISCLTARGVLAAIDRDRFDVICVGIARGGRWVRVDESVVASYAIRAGVLPTVSADLQEAVMVRHRGGVAIAGRDGDRLVDLTPIDVAFGLLHGPFGEDGTVQGLFEMYGLRYVGAGVLSSAVCQDKVAMKQQLAACGLPVGPYVSFTDLQWRTDPDSCLDEVDTLTYPVFVKPARGGSSIGISRVTDRNGVASAIEEARRHDPRVIVEQGFVGMREIECAVLGDPSGMGPATSLPGEIIVNTADKFYDFGLKYLPDQPVEVVAPADVTAEVAARVREVAAIAFTGLGIEGLARVDTFVLADGSVVINEVNTMPGFTPTSGYPLMWQASGVDYPTLVSRLVDLALARPVGLR
jgi:D-alanine-D-alanine ligase